MTLSVHLPVRVRAPGSPDNLLPAVARLVSAHDAGRHVPRNARPKKLAGRYVLVDKPHAIERLGALQDAVDTRHFGLDAEGHPLLPTLPVMIRQPLKAEDQDSDEDADRDGDEEIGAHLGLPWRQEAVDEAREEGGEATCVIGDQEARTTSCESLAAHNSGVQCR